MQMNKITQTTMEDDDAMKHTTPTPVGADLSCPPPIYRPSCDTSITALIRQHALSRPESGR
ncbi:MAG TPA: hypothetical protein VKP04_09420, partial [Ktedonobacteraceae bacterium]|nr:hypothetical protein [Ktedonobacteraceae bacterium]